MATEQAAEDIDFSDASLHFNRELSLLEFNTRVLAQARNEDIPLLERLNYLCISSSNLDEFYEVRAASLIQLAELDPLMRGSDDLTAQEQLNLIAPRAHELVDEQYRVLYEMMIPQLANEGVCFIRRADWTEKQRHWLNVYFNEELLPILTPVGLDSAHPFPRILNKSLNFIVSLSGKDAFGRNSGRAILQAPRALTRLVRIPDDISGNEEGDSFVFLSSIIHAFIDELFNGMKVKHCHQFRVTRNSDLYVDDDAVDDLFNAVQGELAMRHYGDEVRLEIDEHCPQETIEFLAARFGLSENQVFPVSGLVNISRIQEIVNNVDRPDLKFKPHKPSIPEVLGRKKNYFDAIKKQDILLHHPFESFFPVVEFIKQAAIDPDVVAIKQTLYRTSSDSPVVNALLKAAQAGKEVTVVIELRARFDERANITLAAKLQDAAINVVYGVVGYKTHAKMCLIIRKEGKRYRDYVHLGTGNYHPNTAKFYTDYGLFSSNVELGADVRKVFVQLTSLGKVTKLDKLLQSPFTLHKGLIAKIEREINFAKKGQPAEIIFKVNSVVEEEIIQALYRASCAGVEIKLIVRGVCSLKPGIKGVSENIEVRSIIGRFLEHTRVYMFANGGNADIYAASADVMGRNMFRRVEACFPIEHKTLKMRILKDLAGYLQDNTESWIMQSDGSYIQSTYKENEAYCVQTALMDEFSNKH
ncbi:MAG: polyphosphate kinase 1 [Methyloprofundus sp.]|nr:polyphosphate kinase 1 [Methyloprofundus sp.]